MKVKKKKLAAKPLTAIEKKRVTIAKDALQQIKAEVYNAVSGNGYVKLGYEKEVKIKNLADVCPIVHEVPAAKMEFQKYINKFVNKSEPCDVCAKGALFLSAIRKFNNFSLEEAGYGLDDSASFNIIGIFGKANANKIEDYFERTDPYNSERGVYWSDQYEDDNDRLIAILKNVIKNRGQFKPEF